LLEVRIAELYDVDEIERICAEHSFETGRDYTAMINSGTRIYLAVDEENDGKIVGFTGLDKEEWNNTMKVVNMFVVPSYRQQGVASRLLSELIADAKQTDYRCIIAEAPSSSNVKGLYSKHGFRVCGYNDRLYTNNGNEIAYWMSLDLKPESAAIRIPVPV